VNPAITSASEYPPICAASQGLRMMQRCALNGGSACGHAVPAVASHSRPAGYTWQGGS